MFRVEKGGCSSGGSCTPRFKWILVAASLPLMLFSLCLITPLALANGTAGTDELSSSSENPSVAAVAGQNDGSGPAATSAGEFSLNQPSAGGPSTVSSDSDTDNTPSSAVNEIISSSGNQDTLSRQGNSAYDSNSQATAISAAAPSNVTANTGTSGTTTTASHESGGDEQHDYELHLVCSAGEKGTYWASREDYDARLLSIDYSLSNTGTGTAYNVQVTEAVANGGVTVATTLPLLLGDIDPGELIYFTLKWLVPRNVGAYTTNITACAESKDDDDGDDEDLNGDKPPGDGSELDFPPASDGGGSLDARTFQSSMQWGEMMPAALPATGFAWLNAVTLTMVLMVCGFFLSLPAIAYSGRRRR